MTRTILAIDDHPDTINLIELALHRHGFEVIGAFSGPEGLEIAERERPDLILLDMMMPGMDGNAVCRAIRQNPDIAGTPIIMFTAKSQATDKKQSFDAGADDYLTKPTRPSELLQRIQMLLGRQAPQEGAEEPPLYTAYKAPRPSFIAVLGARGGAGATTVAINIAATLANSDNETMLVDLDTRQGHAAVFLGHNVVRDIVEWLGQPAGALDESLPDYLVQIQEGLTLLPSRMRLNSDQARLRAPQMAALCSILEETQRTVVVDVGSHHGDAVRPILQQSDIVLICLRAERAALMGARRMLEELPKIITPAKIQLLLLDYGAGETMPRPAIESYLEKPLCDIVRLNLDDITRAANRHQPLVVSAADSNVPRQFEQLLHVLLPAD